MQPKQSTAARVSQASDRGARKLAAHPPGAGVQFWRSLPPENDLKTLPLEDLHRAAGARFGPFAGWTMPVTYPLGVIKEHLHTRDHAGLFDISHMRLFDVEGLDAAALLALPARSMPTHWRSGSQITFSSTSRRAFSMT